jgi:hypothetical protein
MHPIAAHPSDPIWPRMSVENKDDAQFLPEAWTAKGALSTAYKLYVSMDQVEHEAVLIPGIDNGILLKIPLRGLRPAEAEEDDVDGGALASPSCSP